MKRIGLLGGSFNPAHEGHKQLSLAAIDALGLDEVWWLVSPGNPLKEGASDMAPFEARLSSAREMAAGTSIKASDFELRSETRYTIDTLQALIRDCPGNRFIWLMGADTIAEFHRWKDWRGIAQLVPIAVLPRPGYDEAAQAARAMGWLSAFVRPESQAKCWTEWSPPAILFLRLPTNPTSATALRALDPNWHRRPGSGSSGSLGDGISPT
ncbi:nicotinate-nucleotide adenylyltransferase [Sphingomonas sp. RG327]|uniref:Probable nicotinate-nucleotide adenylyltransferase n=1 Tax=Sphingomonas anseongensis TaxID=2908207 RepID=A0ABT0RHJ8_9SPHN|nr:nicotinate-nucleotide adenylyltransferase [Sphingomonas anseongensis]MCL6679752.1 nicotinate-nucleotide adenylyltransferase [Sphingomonas anseongensis]